MRGKADLGNDTFGGFVGGFAFGADFAYETLGKNAFKGCGDEERLDSHVNKTGDSAWCVVGVETGENEVTGEGGLDGDLSGVQVACFADHDPVGILTEEGAQDASKGETDGFGDGNLLDTFEFVFDGIFDGENFGIDAINAAEAGVESGCFTGAGGAGDDEDAVRFFDGGADMVVDTLRHAEGLKLEIDDGFIENAEDEAFTELGRKSGDAQVDRAARHGGLNASVLGDSAFGDVEIGHDLDT